MVTVYREAGLRIVIFIDDHEPAHVHVIGDGHAKINLVGADGLPELVYADGVRLGEGRRMMRIVRTQQAMLLVRWKEIHG